MSRAFWLGIFIVATLLILAGGVFLIGDKELLFSSTYRLKAVFYNVAGLSDGAEVRVGGTHQGTVRHIDLPDRPDGKVTVVMDLENRTRNVISKGSVASIKTEGLLGNKYVEISFGSPGAEHPKDGDTIESEAPLDISDLMKKTDQMLDSANDTMQNAASISSKIDEGKGTVGALINDKTIYQQASAATAEARAGATALHENMEALKHNFLLRGFFKKRGYEDSDQLTRNEISRLPSTPDMKRFVYDAKRLFDKPETAKLKNPKVLQEAGQYLEEKKFGLAVVTAYAGMTGDSHEDQVLTSAQTAVLRDYLAKNFRLDDTRLKTMGLGKAAEPADSGKVEIIIYPVASSLPTARDRSSAVSEKLKAPQMP